MNTEPDPSVNDALNARASIRFMLRQADLRGGFSPYLYVRLRKTLWMLCPLPAEVIIAREKLDERGCCGEPGRREDGTSDGTLCDSRDGHGGEHDRVPIDQLQKVAT